MEQLHKGFSDSPPKWQIKKSAKSLLTALQLISISQISTQKYGSGHFEPFKIARKFRPIGGRLMNHSDQSEDALRIYKLYFASIQKNEIFFLHLFFRYRNYLLTIYCQSNI